MSLAPPLTRPPIRRLVACDPLRDEAGELLDTGSRLLTITFGREIARPDGGTTKLGGLAPRKWRAAAPARSDP
jgi:hypothetical protein